MITKDPLQQAFFTELQKLEEENLKLRKQNRQLLAENRQLGQILGVSECGIFIRDHEHRFVYVNEAFCKHLHLEKSQILSKRPKKLGKIAKKYFKDDHEVRRSGMATFNLFKFEDEQSNLRWIKSMKYPFQDSNQHLAGIFGFTQEVTEITELSREVKETSVALRKSNMTNEALRQFSYAASHDLQEPLRAVQGFLKLVVMEQEGLLGAKALQYIELAESSITSMQTLIKDILDYAVINEARYELGTVDLNEVVKATKLNLDQLIQDSQATITADQLPIVKGNESLLVHFFQNIISNAIKYRRTGVDPVIEITHGRKSDKFIVAIGDNGIGIEEQFFQEIFKPFKRLHRKSEFGGSGIGLATSKKIIELHGGTITVESQKGAGTTFYAELPVS